MRFILAVLAMLLVGAINPARAYEQPTHALITYHSFARSKLNTDGQLTAALGLNGAHPLGTGQDYMYVFTEFMFPSEFTRKSQNFENDIINALGNPPNSPIEPTSIVSWLMRGVIREDDNPKESNLPQDAPDPADTINRPLHHFFDPRNDRALDINGLSVLDSDVHKNPDWAMGTRNSFASPVVPEIGRRNTFSVLDAREAMWRALTLQRVDGTDVPLTTSPAEREGIRLAYWATVFRALGDVLHLNQDMAQPQHTRNEAHSGKGGPIIEAIASGHSSVYEKYINARALHQPTFKIDGTLAVPLAGLHFDDNDPTPYPIPTFARYSDYWSTSPGAGSLSGTGLADYSNHGFFTIAHNLGEATYSSPPNNANDPGYTHDNLPCGYGGTTPIFFSYLTGAVPDSIAGQSATIKRTAYGLWKYSSTGHGSPTIRYTLNKCNYDDMASLLIPRAVAYSAGLINYFFRGRMEINLPDEGFYSIVDHAKFNDAPFDVNYDFRGFSKIKVKLKNTTIDIVDPLSGTVVKQDMQAGSQARKLVAVVKFHRNKCYDNALASLPLTLADAASCRNPVEEIVVSQPLSRGVPYATNGAFNGDTIEFQFDKEIPINAWEVQLQVVYRGPLGTEDDAVVVTTKDISEPTFVAMMNATDFFLQLDKVVYKPSQINADQTLLAKVRPDCRTGTVGSYQLNANCYNFSEGFTYQATPSNVTISGQVAARHLARLALLQDSNIDVATTWSAFNWQSGAVTCPIFLNKPERLRPFVAQTSWIGQPTPHSSFSYSPPIALRGVNAWEMMTCINSVGFSTPKLTADVLQNFGNSFPAEYVLTPDEAKPVPLTIVGW